MGLFFTSFEEIKRLITCKEFEKALKGNFFNFNNATDFLEKIVQWTIFTIFENKKR